MRPIDADKLIEEGWVLDRHGVSNKLLTTMSLADVPTVDAVPVVRCKDCKHWGCGLPMEMDHAKCCGVGGYMVGENGYGCYGEKKK